MAIWPYGHMAVCAEGPPWAPGPGPCRVKGKVLEKTTFGAEMEQNLQKELFFAPAQRQVKLIQTRLLSFFAGAKLRQCKQDVIKVKSDLRKLE